MAFGTEFGGSWGKLALSLFRVFAIGLIAWYLYKLVKSKANIGLIISIGLVFAGAFGNIIDSVFYGMMFDQTCTGSEMYCTGTIVAERVPWGEGYEGVFFGKVVDMMQFTVNWPSWVPGIGGNEVFPFIFNIADAAITIGVIIIILFSKRFFPEASNSDWSVSRLFKKKPTVNDQHKHESSPTDSEKED